MKVTAGLSATTVDRTRNLADPVESVIRSAVRLPLALGGALDKRLPFASLIDTPAAELAVNVMSALAIG